MGFRIFEKYAQIIIGAYRDLYLSQLTGIDEKGLAMESLYINANHLHRLQEVTHSDATVCTGFHMIPF